MAATEKPIDIIILKNVPIPKSVNDMLDKVCWGPYSTIRKYEFIKDAIIEKIKRLPNVEESSTGELIAHLK